MSLFKRKNYVKKWKIRDEKRGHKTFWNQTEKKFEIFGDKNLEKRRLWKYVSEASSSGTRNFGL